MVVWGRTIAHDNGCSPVHRFLGDPGTEVVGEQNCLLLRRGLKAKALLAVLVHVAKEQAHVIPGSVGHFLGIPKGRDRSQYEPNWIRGPQFEWISTVLSSHIPPSG